MNKSLKEYIIESTQTYQFKVKLVGDRDGDSANIKKALARFDVGSISESTRTPIQETQADFPGHSNINVTMYDISLAYPATSLQIQSALAEALNLSTGCIRVRTLKEQEEDSINHAHDVKTGKAMLGTDYEPHDNQNIVGDKHTMSLLKELGKHKTSGTQYTGTNDQLLAKKSPSDNSSTSTVNKKTGSISMVGSKKTKVTIGK